MNNEPPNIMHLNLKLDFNNQPLSPEIKPLEKASAYTETDLSGEFRSCWYNVEASILIE